MTSTSEIRVAFVGFFLPKGLFRFLENREKQNSVQTQVFSQNILASLKQASVPIWVESFAPIADFPISRFLVAPSATFSRTVYAGKVRSFINLPILKHLTRYITLLFQSYRSIKEFNASHVLVYSVNSALLSFGIFIMFFTKRKVISIFTDPPGVYVSTDGTFRKLLKRIDRFIVSKLLPHFDGFISLTPYAAKHFFHEGTGLIVNGFFNPLDPHKSGISKHKLPTVFTYAGTLDEQSGIDKLITAFLHLSALDAVLNIYGSGFFSDWITDISKLDSRIRFFGKVSREAVFDAYLDSDVLICSRNPLAAEALFVFPSKIHETMSTAIPVISTRMPGIPEEYFEFLIDAKLGTESDFVEVLLFAANNSELINNIGLQAREFLIRNKSFSEVGNQIKSYLQDLK